MRFWLRPLKDELRRIKEESVFGTVEGKEGKGMRNGLVWVAREEEVNGLRGINKEVEKMRKWLSVVVGIAILLFAYSASAEVVTNGLVSWWKFDETSGTTAADSYEGPHYNTGTVNNALWTNVTAGSASSGALYFDGNCDQVAVPDDTSLDCTNAITIDMWVKPNSVDGYFPLVVKGSAGSYYTKLHGNIGI